MYKEHFGFSGELFGEGLATDAAVFQSMRQRRLAANLSIALTRRDSVAVVYGAAGTGKTTIISHALRETTTRLALGYIVHAPQTPHELLEQLLTEFGFTPYKNSRTERLQNWRQFLGEMSATETRVSILVENAQDLPLDVLKALHDLTVADGSGSAGANLILTATTALDDLLTAPALTALRQRIRLQATLPALTADEARDYLTFKLAAVGSDYDKIFAPDAAPILHAVSGGIIRVIDNVVESALAVAAARHEATVSGRLLKRVAIGLFGIPPAALGMTAESTAALATAGTTAKAAAKPPESSAGTDAPTPKPVQSPQPAAGSTREAGLQARSPKPVEADPSPAAAGVAGESAPPAKPAAPAAAASSDSSRKSAQASKATHQAPSGSPSPSQPAAASSPEPGVEPDEAVALAAALKAVEALETNADEQPAEANQSALEIAAATSTDIEALDAGFDLGFADPDSHVELMLDVETETDNAAAVDTADTDIDINSGDSADDAAVPAAGAVADPAFDSSLDAEADALFVAAVAASMGADEDNDVDADRDAAPDDDDPAERPAEIPTLTDSVEVAAADEGESADEIYAAFATAKALEDISNSMAETLFGDAELDQLAATFAARIAKEEAFAERELAADESAEDSAADAVVKSA